MFKEFQSNDPACVAAGESLTCRPDVPLPPPTRSDAHDPIRRPQQPDRAIAAAVRAALRFSLGSNSARISVVVRRGVVSLFGNLDWEFDQFAAVECVATVAGVMGTVDHLVLSSILDVRPTAR